MYIKIVKFFAHKEAIKNIWQNAYTYEEKIKWQDISEKFHIDTTIKYSWDLQTLGTGNTEFTNHKHLDSTSLSIIHTSIAQQTELSSVTYKHHGRGRSWVYMRNIWITPQQTNHLGVCMCVSIHTHTHTHREIIKNKLI